MPQIEFVYFDLGNVIVNFSHDLMVRQISQVSNVEPDVVRRVFFDEGLQEQYETGHLSTDQFHEKYCQLTASKVAVADLETAASDIFSLNIQIVPIIGQMQIAGIRLGIISNTCEAHWKWVSKRYSILRTAFYPVVLSYEVGSVKPHSMIFEHAIEQANCPAEQIFFTDDRPEHIEGAKTMNLHASQFVSAKQLAKDLKHHGLRFNY